MSDNHTFHSFEAQLRAASRDIVTTDLATAPTADPAAAEAIVAAAPVAAADTVVAARPRRVALWPTVATAAACLALGYVLPHPQQEKTVSQRPSARVERIETVRTDTVYRERRILQTVERIVERPVIQTVEVVRVDTVVVAPAETHPHAPRSLANDGFIYAFNTMDE